MEAKMYILVRAFFAMILLNMAGTAYSSEKFGIYEDSEWVIGISHKSTGYAMGSCSEGFLLEVPKGGGSIELDIALKFVGSGAKETFTGRIQTSLAGTTGGRSVTEYVESPDLCFDVKEVIVIEATGTVNGQSRDLIREHKISQSGFIPHPIRIDTNG